MQARHVILCMLCLHAAAAVAQAPMPSPDPQPRIERLATLLDLDESQKVAVQAVLEEQRVQMEALREQARAAGQRPTPEQMHAQREQMQSETLEKLRGVLSADQLKKFAALPPPPPPGGPGFRGRGAQ